MAAVRNFCRQARECERLVFCLGSQGLTDRRHELGSIAARFDAAAAAFDGSPRRTDDISGLVLRQVSIDGVLVRSKIQHVLVDFVSFATAQPGDKVNCLTAGHELYELCQ